MEYLTIDEVRLANRRIRHHFFDHDTMDFFRSQVEEPMYGGRWFVTSEQGPDAIRRWTVRRGEADGRVRTEGDFQQYPTSADAHDAALALERGGVPRG